MFGLSVSKRTGGHSGPPLRREFGICNTRDIRNNNPNIGVRTRWSAPTRRICDPPQSNVYTEQRDTGWNVERMCREPDIPATGGCKPAHNRRLAGRAPSTMVKSNKSLPNFPLVTIGDGRPTRQHHATSQRSRTQHRTEFASHPARSAQTRCIHLASALLTSITSKTTTLEPSGIDTRGRTRRSDPTQRICNPPPSNVYTEQRDGGWNVERVCREPEILVNGACKPAHIRRLAGRAPSTMVKNNKSLQNQPIVTIGDGRPTGQHHATDQPSRTNHKPEFS